MTPILGIWASSIAKVTGSFESIATITAGSGGATSIEFTSIPSTYTHLQIRGIMRTNDTGTWNNNNMRFNGDTGNNYANHFLYGDGSTVSVAAYASYSLFPDFMRTPSNTGIAANIYGAVVLDILDYANTNKYKTFRSLNGGDSNGAGVMFLTSGVWMSTSAITSIQIIPSGGTAIQYSQFALYGIKAA